MRGVWRWRVVVSLIAGLACCFCGWYAVDRYYSARQVPAPPPLSLTAIQVETARAVISSNYANLRICVSQFDDWASNHPDDRVMAIANSSTSCQILGDRRGTVKRLQQLIQLELKELSQIEVRYDFVNEAFDALERAGRKSWIQEIVQQCVSHPNRFGDATQIRIVKIALDCDSDPTRQTALLQRLSQHYEQGLSESTVDLDVGNHLNNELQRLRQLLKKSQSPH